jgi:hypothetical protein
MNVVSTSFSLPRINEGVYFIKQVVETSSDIVDKILIWNFDLGSNNIEKRINTYLGKDIVKVVPFPKETYQLYPEYFGRPGQFAWTTAVWWFSRMYGDNILWMDADKPPIISLDKTFEFIEKEDIFACSGYGPDEYIKNWTHDECKRQMNITEEIGNKRIIHAGTLGYKKNGKYDKIFEEAYNWSKIREVIQGIKTYHARDQAVVSTLLASTDYVFKVITSEKTDSILLSPKNGKMQNRVVRTIWTDKPNESDVILKIERW